MPDDDLPMLVPSFRARVELLRLNRIPRRLRLEHGRVLPAVHLHIDIHNRFPPVPIGVRLVPPILRLFPDFRQGVVFLRRSEIRRQRQQQRARGKNPFHPHVCFLLRPQPFICIERQRGKSSRIFEKNFLLFRRVLSL